LHLNLLHTGNGVVVVTLVVSYMRTATQWAKPPKNSLGSQKEC